MATVRTGKMLEREVLDELHELHRTAATTPVMVTGLERRKGPDGIDNATKAWTAFYDRCNAVAEAAGLPKMPDFEGDPVHYGVDYTTGEILGWKPD